MNTDDTDEKILKSVFIRLIRVLFCILNDFMGRGGNQHQGR